MHVEDEGLPVLAQAGPESVLKLHGAVTQPQAFHRFGETQKEPSKWRLMIERYWK